MRLARVTFALLLPLFGALHDGAASSVEALPDLPSGELQALRAVLDAALEGTDYQRVEVGRYLLVRRDSAAERAAGLERLPAALAAANQELVGSFSRRNQDKFRLWLEARLRLGERTDPRVMLLSERHEIHAQFARAGWDATRSRALVYLELRPFEGAEKFWGVFRVVAREGDGWKVLAGAHEISRDRFRP